MNTFNIVEGKLSLRFFFLVLLCQYGVKAVSVATCEGETAQLSCDLTSKVVTCESNDASLHCERGYIKVISANYGRTDGSTCSSGRPAEEISNIQCTQSTTLNVLTSLCDGQKDCTVPASNEVFGDPCYGTYKFLDVSYTCILPGSVIKRMSVCEGETYNLKCDEQIIKVISANYGRTEGSTCSTGRPAGQISNVLCTQSTTLNVLTIQCDGKHDCSVPATNNIFGDPCDGTYKYLNVTYVCHHRYVRVKAANYGRTDGVTCTSGRPVDQISNVQCTQSSSLSILNTLCNGKQTCSVPATNAVFSDPCYGTYKYLNVSYSCGQSVKPMNGATCEGETAQLSCALTSKVVTCESNNASLHCKKGQIKVISANYGRTDRSTCSSGRPAGEISNIQCTRSTTLNVLTSLCDGQKDCTVPASNTVFGDPCVGTYKFLDVSYTCIPSGAVIKTMNTCEGETFNLNCSDQIIKVISANYGRTDRSMCSSGRPANQISNTRCIQSTTLNFLTTQCDGKQTCSVPATNSVFGDPCYGTYKYLSVSYVCRPNHQFIKVYAANYGRTDAVTCISGRPADQISNVQCSQSSTLNVITNQCDGKQTCSVPVTNTVFGDPCNGIYKYLNVSYSCGPNPAVKTPA